MIKQIKRFRSAREKGQVLVVLALTITMLVAFVGLSVDMGYMYVSYARLRRTADAAALAATGQFKKSKTPADMQNAAMQFLKLNEINAKAVTVESCYFKFDGTISTPYAAPAGSGDADLCKLVPQKLVRVTISEDVPTFFLAVIGWRKIPITVASISEAASLDIVLVLDKSESMAQYDTNYNILPAASRDPKPCNDTTPSSCHPFDKVVGAAKSFLDSFLFEPYDQAAIVTFAQFPAIETIGTAKGLNGNISQITAALDGLKVYQGGDDLPGGIPNTCDSQDYGSVSGFGGYSIAHPEFARYNIFYQCRLFEWSNDGVDPWPGVLEPGSNRTTFRYFDCPRASAASSQTPPQPVDYSDCQTSNTGSGLKTAAYIFSGPAGMSPPRAESLWVTILLTDGVANASNSGVPDANHPYGPPYCGGTSSNGSERQFGPYCRDTNAYKRHCLAPYSPTYPCEKEDIAASYPGLALPGSDFYVDPLNYDADDFARDQADVLHDGTHSLIFVIGIGDKNNPQNEIMATLGKDGTTILADPGTPPSGDTLLKYIASKGETGPDYYFSDPAGLQKVFLAIANRISTRLTH